RVDLETLTGLTENPGELAGFGPVIADIARRVTAEQESAEWRWTVVDETIRWSTPGSPLADPPPLRNDTSQRASGVASSPDVGCRRPTVTSTTG
ncbi:MAG: hypothetical protein O7D28_03120, partial [Actinobacteria bacterium]|nr:hypothetical protein [Actinomycetota bacterium]